MRVLVLSSTFPNAQQPTRGVFVQHRIRRLARRCEIVVVAPVPWFPMNRWLRGERDAVPHAHLNLARVYIEEGRLDEAAVQLELSAKCDPPAPAWSRRAAF